MALSRFRGALGTPSVSLRLMIPGCCTRRHGRPPRAGYPIEGDRPGAGFSARRYEVRRRAGQRDSDDGACDGDFRPCCLRLPFRGSAGRKARDIVPRAHGKRLRDLPVCRPDGPENRLRVAGASRVRTPPLVPGRSHGASRQVSCGATKLSDSPTLRSRRVLPDHQQCHWGGTEWPLPTRRVMIDRTSTLP